MHTAGIYLADEEMGAGFAYSGWAQVSLPVRRPADDAIWSVASERVKLLIEPGRRPIGDDCELVGVPWGCHARLILLWLQSEALRTTADRSSLGTACAIGSAESAFRSEAKRIAQSVSRPNVSADAGSRSTCLAPTVAAW